MMNADMYHYDRLQVIIDSQVKRKNKKNNFLHTQNCIIFSQLFSHLKHSLSYKRQTTAASSIQRWLAIKSVIFANQQID